MKNVFYLTFLSLLITACKNNKQNQSVDHQNHQIEVTDSSNNKASSP